MPLKHTVEEIVLDNGIKGLLIDVPDATVVSYSIYFRAGFSYADPNIHETPHLMEHMVASGINDRFIKKGDYDEEFTKNGAYKNAITSETRMTYIAESAVMEYDRIIDLMHLTLTRPTFTETLLDAEKRTIKEELSIYLNNNIRVAYQCNAKAMGVLQTDGLEQIELIDNVKLSDIEDCYYKHYTLNNMRFVLVGDLKLKRQQIIDRFQTFNLPEGNRLPTLKATAKRSSAVKLDKDTHNLTYGIEISINRLMSQSERIAINIVNHILTGTFNSRIFGEARKRGICYRINSYASVQQMQYSSWRFFGEVGQNNIVELFQLVADQIKLLLDKGISEDDLVREKQYFIGNYQMKGQTVGNLSEWYAMPYYDYDEILSLDKYSELVNSITTNDITNIVVDFIKTNIWCLSVIGMLSDDDLKLYESIVAQAFDDGGVK